MKFLNAAILIATTVLLAAITVWTTACKKDTSSTCGHLRVLQPTTTKNDNNLFSTDVCMQAFIGQIKPYTVDIVGAWMDMGATMTSSEVQLTLMDANLATLATGTATCPAGAGQYELEFKLAASTITIPVGQKFFVSLGTTGGCKWMKGPTNSVAGFESVINGTTSTSTAFSLRVTSTECQ